MNKAINNKISVFTPTFNRAPLLSILYASLLTQGAGNFEWIIVDDGSTDNTKEVVDSFIKEGKLDITYFKQTNKGKHIAINKGLDLATGEWFFIVDSDDYLTNDALKLINKYILQDIHEQYDGFVFRRAFENKTIVGGKYPEDKQMFVANMIERTVKYKIAGDMAEVFKTNLLKKCKFDEINGENFCAEGLMWHRTANIGKPLLYVDSPIYICEYLPGGLSDNSIINRRKSSGYSTLLYKELAESPHANLKLKIKSYINYWRFSFFTTRSCKDKLSFINYNILGILCYPIGAIFKLKDDMTISKNKRIEK